jgi:hypothetical protein
MISIWFNVEHYHNTHSTQYRCTHYTLLLTAWCFQSVCNSVTPWCVILFSTNSSPLVHPPVHFPPEQHQSRHPHTAGTFSWNADCIMFTLHQTKMVKIMECDLHGVFITNGKDKRYVQHICLNRRRERIKIDFQETEFRKWTEFTCSRYGLVGWAVYM